MNVICIILHFSNTSRGHAYSTGYHSDDCRIASVIVVREAGEATTEALTEVAQLEGQLQQARTLGEELSQTTAALTRRLEDEQVSFTNLKGLRVSDVVCNVRVIRA